MHAEVFRSLLMTLSALAGQTLDSGTAGRAIALAKTELSRSTNVASGAIAVVSSTAAEWHDSSLGCPQRGVVYTPVITAGYLVRLRAGDREYAVHVGAGRAAVCGMPSPIAGTGAKIISNEAVVGLKRAEEARADLAKSLGVPPASIAIDYFRATTWPDSRLGCAGDAPPSTAVTLLPANVRGFLIQLSSGGKTYEFHSDATNRPRRCRAN